MESSFYMLDSNGDPITHDRNGRPLAPIRHVRCYAKAGRGFLKIDTALNIKRQTYLSKNDYKNNYYAQNDDNYLCLFYEGMEKGKLQRAFRLVNYLDIARLKMKTTNALFTEPEFCFYNGNRSMPLIAAIKKGTRVLMYTNFKEEIKEMDIDALSKRLFIVYKFNTIGTPNIYLRHHLEARTETDCESSEKATEFNANTISSYLSLKASKFKALIEHLDFEIDPLGTITFNNP